MKITIDRNGDDVHMKLEREPMPPERFSALYKLALTAIGGGVLLAAVHMVGMLAICAAVGVFLAYGLYRVIQEV